MLTRQLVQGQLADVALCLAEDDAMPAHRRQGDRAARWRTHQRLADAAHHVLVLLGASGFLACPPATDLHLAAVTATSTSTPGTGGDDRGAGGGDD